MRRVACAAWLIVQFVSINPLPAEEPAAALPMDGAWVRYTVTTRREGFPEEITKRTYSIVGTKIENDQRCRWIEIKETMQFDGVERIDIVKFLIPEKDLLENERPLNGLLRTWRKFDNEDVNALKFESPEGFPGSPHFYFGYMFVIFPGAHRDFEVVREPKIVDYQQGQSKIPTGRAGQYVAKRRAVTAEILFTMKLDFTVWLDRTVPLGPAAWTQRLEMRQDDVVRRVLHSEFIVEDFGSDAKSALPDHD